jgi:hypothetical protein
LDSIMSDIAIFAIAAKARRSTRCRIRADGKLKVHRVAVATREDRLVAATQPLEIKVPDSVEHAC